MAHRSGRPGILREEGDPVRRLHRIWNAALDLESSDQFAWMNGHAEFGGTGMVEAMQTLLSGLGSGDREASILAAATLNALFRHSAHGCFDRTALGLLSAGGKRLGQAMEEELDPEVLAEMRQAMQEFEAMTDRRNARRRGSR